MAGKLFDSRPVTDEGAALEVTVEDGQVVIRRFIDGFAAGAMRLDPEEAILLADRIRTNAVRLYTADTNENTLEVMLIELAAPSNCCQLIQWGSSDGWECVVVHTKGEGHKIYRASTPIGAVSEAYRDRTAK